MSLSESTLSLLEERPPKSGFGFRQLMIPGINKEHVFAVNDSRITEEETCLFHQTVPDGQAYFHTFHQEVIKAASQHRPLPCARFADDEHAFYAETLGCNGLNGLYRQAESNPAIRKALSMHVEALKHLSAKGKIAPLISPGNDPVNRSGKTLPDIRRASRYTSGNRVLSLI